MGRSYRAIRGQDHPRLPGSHKAEEIERYRA